MRCRRRDSTGCRARARGGQTWRTARSWSAWPSRPRARGADTGVRELADEAEGLEWVWVSDKAFADDDEALVYAIRAQSTRRNLEPGELVLCIARLDAIKQRGERTDLAPRGAKSGKSAVETATLGGVGGRTVERARKVLADDDARAAVESGEKSINAASKDVRPGRRLYRYEGRVD